MANFGFFENGDLVVKTIEPIKKMVPNEDGVPTPYVVSVDEQAKLLPPGWKTIEPMDEARLATTRENYIVRAVPFDAGDRIAFRYEEVPDLQKIKAQIEERKEQLAASDYQVIKCYEATLAQQPLPYNMAEVHAARQAIRDEINLLEDELARMEVVTN